MVVIWVLKRCYRGITGGVTGVLQEGYKGFTRVTQGCYRGFKGLSQRCYTGVTGVIKGFTRVLLECYRASCPFPENLCGTF